jgi:nucleoside-diphosphate-sugar epimerase
MNTMNSKKILLLGASSFAARGLVEALEAEGHSVTCFGRGPTGKMGTQVTGSVFELTKNPYLKQFDHVINYIVLKDAQVEPNERYIDELVKFCSDRQIPHLIHVSSISVFKSSISKITEAAEVERNPKKKGSYGSLKVAADLRLMASRPPSLKITYLRPGFILGSGVVSPIIGMAFRFGDNKLLQLGSGENILPITTRELVNQAVCNLCGMEQAEVDKVVLVVDGNSPTRSVWLHECCTSAGAARQVIRLPLWFWYLAGLGGEFVAKVLRLKISPWTIVQNACRVMRFYPQESERYLGMSFACDWRKELANSLEKQKQTSSFSVCNLDSAALKNKKRVVFIGYGGIVKQRHLDGLKVLGFDGAIEAYDLVAYEDGPQKVHSIAEFKGGRSDLWVVATPGHVHNQALPLLSQTEGPVVIEKPLCCSPAEYEAWIEFSQQRQSLVTVCHNYRFKKNMRQFFEHLQKYNTGKLLHAHLEFQSPPVSMDSAAWRKKEREARTLLMDYGLHFLDIACMFHTQKWDVIAADYTENRSGERDCITGLLSSKDYQVSFVLRQGFQPRKCRLFFTFQNYGVSLGFFPDTFVPHMADDSAGVYKHEAIESRHATCRKIVDKLTNRNSDLSHAAILGMSVQAEAISQSVTIVNLKAFYDCMFELGDRVYGSN